jgi:integrase
LVIMRPCDIETSGKIWQYRPKEHKTKYRDHGRIVSIGPMGQKVLRPFLKRNLEEYCFSPIESGMEQNQKRVKSDRKTKVSQKLRNRYDRDSYRRAVKYAVKAAQKAGLMVPDFHPHQLRHTAATRIRKEMGLDAARAMLGHRNLKITDDYAELDQALAGKAAMKLG